MLIGCVKTKRALRSPAKDLYDSPLWRCRREYAERLGGPWYILSALHGLLESDRCIDPYDLALTDLRVGARRAWSARVLDSLKQQVPSIQGKTIEIHAGAAYVEYGLEEGLRDSGAIVRRPLAQISGVGSQQAWYRSHATQLPTDRMSTHQLSAGVSDACRKARLIADDFYGTGLNLASRNIAASRPWFEMPEVAAVRQLRATGAIHEDGSGSTFPGCERNPKHDTAVNAQDRAVRLFLTFIAALDRARDAFQLWKAAVQLHADRPELFEPGHVAGLDREALRAVLQRARVSRRHGPDSEAWHRIAQSLACENDSPVVCVIDSGRGDAQELRRDLRSRNDDGNRFPLLRGPKIGPMWVRMMAHPGGAKIDGIETVPVAVDVQVRRATENLGVAATNGLPLRKAKPLIQRAWMDAASNTEFAGPTGIEGTCAALDPALWYFGKHGCGHCELAGEQVKFGRACESCIRFH